jgi:hypothetical protein
MAAIFEETIIVLQQEHEQNGEQKSRWKFFVG